MLTLGHPRDLLMIGAIFGVAAFIWAGWAQENPPPGIAWRVALGILSVLGLVLAAVSIPVAISHWGSGSEFDTKSSAFVVYIVVFWVEVAAMIALSIWANAAGRSDLIAPLILAIVGLHFVPLAWVFAQPYLAVTGVILTAAAAFAAFTGIPDIARSFWCGVVAAPVLLAAGAWGTVAGIRALRS